MAVKIDLTEYYPVNVCDDVNWWGGEDYNLNIFFDELEDYKNSDFNNCKLKWFVDDDNGSVYFNSLAAVYDFNLIFGHDRILVKTRPLDYDDYDKITGWLYDKFGTDSSLEYIFWEGSLDCGAPNWRWRHLREYTGTIGNITGEVIEYAFANKCDALQFKLAWG
jgi:hypothetical protein